ncbi:MAG: Membrane-fusion protein [Rhodobacteraceae bacterium HLUCCO07]|nr:MAG: Membrane-fusion protein [Rhodobacteraceae bacterium HLUCCO07]
MRMTLLASVLALILPALATAETEHKVRETTITEWKAVFGKVEARDNVPARARLGGTLVEIEVTEGSPVTEGQQIGTIDDAKLELQLDSVEAQIDVLRSQLENAQTELTRGEDLLARGVTTAQRLDSLRTQVDVLTNQIESTEAEKRVIAQQEAEGAVIAPISGRVLDVPVTQGSVVMAGEAVATIGGGGFFLRLAVPERHAAFLEEGADIQIGDVDETRTGRLAKVYPQIENGRVIADVEVEGLDARYVDARVLVRLPVGETRALLIPAELVSTRMGLDFVTVQKDDGPALRAIVPGQHHLIDGVDMVEVLSGLVAGETVIPSTTVNYTPSEGH